MNYCPPGRTEIQAGFGPRGLDFGHLHFNRHHKNIVPLVSCQDIKLKTSHNSKHCGSTSNQNICKKNRSILLNTEGLKYNFNNSKPRKENHLSGKNVNPLINIDKNPVIAHVGLSCMVIRRQDKLRTVLSDDHSTGLCNPTQNDGAAEQQV